MKDETYSFISDVKEKGGTARSARNRRGHTGKGGKVRLPSDNLSKKELMKMSGEVKHYRLNDPMDWKEFRSMPDDLKVTYIKLLRQKFNVPDKNLAEMFGINKDYIYRQFKALGLCGGIKTSHPKWDKEGFWAWVHGEDKLPTPVMEEPEEIPFDIVPVNHNERKGVVNLPLITPIQETREPVKWEEPEAFVEDEVMNLKFQVESLIKINEELSASNDKAKCENEWLRNECDSLRVNVRILEAQMEVVRMIFGGNNHE